MSIKSERRLRGGSRHPLRFFNQIRNMESKQVFYGTNYDMEN